MTIDLKAGIVRVLKPNGETSGTGFVVTDDGFIATRAHVVEAAEAGPGDTVRVAFHATGEEREARVEPTWWRDPNAEDVAILRLERPLPEGTTPLRSHTATAEAIVVLPLPIEPEKVKADVLNEVMLHCQSVVRKTTCPRRSLLGTATGSIGLTDEGRIKVANDAFFRVFQNSGSCAHSLLVIPFA